MAPVNPGDCRDRAQLLLVGAIGVATALVVIAVVLNTGIYTENLATRQASGAADAATSLRDDVRGGLGRVVIDANRDPVDADYPTRESEFEADAGDWEELGQRYVAIDGDALVLDETATDYAHGTRIGQDADATFTDRQGTADWTVASDVKPRRIRFDVSRSGLIDISSFPLTDTFKIEITDEAGDIWLISVYRDTTTSPSSTKVEVEYPSGDTLGPCSESEGSRTVIDLTAGTLDGQRCEALRFFDRSDDPMTIEYLNADQIEGQYDLVVDRKDIPLRETTNAANYGEHCDGPSYFDLPANGDPFTAPALYATTTGLTYQSSETIYETDVRAAPGERGSAAASPVIEEFDVSDPSGGDGDFTVDNWATRDPNGDSVTVDLVLTEDDGDTTSQTGLSGTGSGVTLDGDDGEAPYELTIEATDGTNTRSVTRTLDDDGSLGGCPA